METQKFCFLYNLRIIAVSNEEDMEINTLGDPKDSVQDLMKKKK